MELIPSENYVFPAVLEALGSIFTNKYSEGYPVSVIRRTGGLPIKLSLAIERAKQLLNPTTPMSSRFRGLHEPGGLFRFA